VLAGFREAWHGCLTRRVDALLELTDALLCAPGPVSSVPSLSLEPTFRRGHGSLYAALAKGRVDAKAARELLVAHRPGDWPLVFAVDTSSWPRCDAECRRSGTGLPPVAAQRGPADRGGLERRLDRSAELGHRLLDGDTDSVRVPPGDDTGRATAAQITALVGRLGATEQAPLLVHDAGYDPVGLTVDLDGVRAQVLVRIRSDRVFSTDPPERAPGAIGRPRRHGRRFACDDPPPGGPDDRLSVNHDQYGHVEVTAWRRLHPRLGHRGRWRHHPGPLPIVGGTIIRVQVQHLAKHATRAVKTLWLWHAGAADADLDACWRAHTRRFDCEHTLRFGKHTLGWVTPRVRHPAQADRWTWLVLAAYPQLRLTRGWWPTSGCRGSGPDPPAGYRPYGSGGVSATCVRAGSPASAPKPCGRSPGRPRAAAPAPHRATRPSRRPPDPPPPAPTRPRPVGGYFGTPAG
jgi:hypothetical protein